MKPASPLEFEISGMVSSLFILLTIKFWRHSIPPIKSSFVMPVTAPHSFPPLLWNPRLLYLNSNTLSHSDLYFTHSIHWYQINLRKILLDFHPNWKIKSIFSIVYRMQSKILSMVFQGLLQSGSNPLFQSTWLLFAYTNPLIQPSSCTYHSPHILCIWTPSCAFVYTNSPDLNAFPISSPYLSPILFLQDHKTLNFIYSPKFSLQIQQSAGSFLYGQFIPLFF